MPDFDLTEAKALLETAWSDDEPGAQFARHRRIFGALVAEVERHRSCRYDIGLRDGSASELPQIERLKAEIERLREGVRQVAIERIGQGWAARAAQRLLDGKGVYDDA